MTLQEIGLKHETDKASHHFYLELYDLLFMHWRRKRVRLLEIGVQFGNSLRTWVEYFPFSDVLGIDSIDNGVIPEGFQVVIADAYDVTTVRQLYPPYDILIDDGSHDPADQAFFVENYLPLLAQDGIGIVEDVPTAGTSDYLETRLPEGFQSAAIEMTKGASMVDSRLLICWKGDHLWRS